KTTLIMAILRLLSNRITEVKGEILFDGVNLLRLPDNELTQIRWKEIAAVFQKSMNALSPVHKIGNQMSDIYRIHKRHISKSKAKQRMIHLLEMVNLPSRVYELYPHELSGGMMQRVAIALSLMHNPKLLILDEATTALDVVTQGQILEEIIEIEKELKTTRIMITHDISIVANMCKKIVIMYAGKVLESGDVKEVISNPQHPYTKGLLKSLPSFKGEKGKIKGISGSLPDLRTTVQGCIFADRCEYVMDFCRKQTPLDHDFTKNHKVACHLVGGIKSAEKQIKNRSY